MRQRESEPTSKLSQYIEDTFGPLDSHRQKIIEVAFAKGVGGMQVAGSEARALYFLAKLIGAKKIVEIGTLYGFSASFLAEALPEDGVLFTLDKDLGRHTEVQDLHRDQNYFSKINFISGPALESLPKIEGEGPFDLVFIDADKGGYVDYLNWAEKNVRKGGLIIGDNTLLFGGVYDENLAEKWGAESRRVMREFNSRLADPKKYSWLFIPSTEGMSVGQKLF